MTRKRRGGLSRDRSVAYLRNRKALPGLSRLNRRTSSLSLDRSRGGLAVRRLSLLPRPFFLGWSALALHALFWAAPR